MDDLEQRLTHAGMAWRQSRPEPPDLDRLVASLDRSRRRPISPRFAPLVAAGLVVLGAIALGPAVGGMLENLRGGLPVTATSPAPTAGRCAPGGRCESPEPTPQSSAAPTGDPARATKLVDDYERALVAGQWQTAFEMLAPESLTRAMGGAAFATERAAYYANVAGRYSIVAPSEPSSFWTSQATLVSGADLSRATVLEVDYPALAGNNAGFQIFVVAPDSTGAWWIWPVR
jgi:hypothetical protein